MWSRDRIASQILAAYGELGFRLAAAMIHRDEAINAVVNAAASSCADPTDWLGFLSTVRERASLWGKAHPEDALAAPQPARRSSAHAALDFSILPVDALSAHEAAAKLDETDRTFLFDVLLDRTPSLDREELERRLAEVLRQLDARVQAGNFPAAEDIP